jgi:hypothetical protein
MSSKLKKQNFGLNKLDKKYNISILKILLFWNTTDIWVTKKQAEV